MMQPHGKDTNKKQPETWIDELPDPLETEADVEELMKMVADKQAKIAADKQNKK